MIRFLFAVLILGGLGWAGYRYIPEERRAALLDSVGITTVVEERIPNYLREKMVISQNPTARRSELIDTVSSQASEISEKLASVDSSKLDAKTAAILSEIQTIATEAEKATRDLKKVNDRDGVIHSTTARIVDAVLPAPTCSVEPEEKES
jgi:hypothetical protein